MKYCTRCGTQLVDEAVVCIGCGCAVGPLQYYVPQVKRHSGWSTAAKVLMVLGTIFMGIYIIPLAWCIPMTVVYFKKIKYNQPVNTSFAIWTMLFVSLLGGIFIICDNEL